MSELEKLLNSVKLAKPVIEEDVSDELESVEYKYDNDRLYDYIALELAREFGNKLAFKGGYMLTKIMTETARRTVDVDLSILTDEIYDDIKTRLTAICEKFMADGIIDRYTVKDEIKERMTGGADMYKDNIKVAGVDVGWHSLAYGISLYSINDTDVRGFSIERMLSDKITAILSRKRFRRPKDLYDIHAISSSFDINVAEVMNCIKMREQHSGIAIEWENYPFDEVIIKEYKKAYNKLIVESVYLGRVIEKPTFEEAFERFSIIVECLLRDTECTWNHSLRRVVK